MAKKPAKSKRKPAKAAGATRTPALSVARRMMMAVRGLRTGGDDTSVISELSVGMVG